MELKIQREWLAKMAEREGNGIISVGGLAACSAPVEALTPAETKDEARKDEQPIKRELKRQ